MKDELRQAARHPVWRALLLLALVVAAIVALSGGFDTAGTRERYPEYGIGASVDSGAFALTPLRAWTAAAAPGRTPSPYLPPARYLVLQLRVVNRTDSSLAATSYLRNDVVWLTGTPAEATVSTHLQRSDGHDLGFELPPRLPVDVDLVWKLPPGAAMPARSTWGVLARRRVAQTYLTRESGWVQQGPLAKLVLAVEQRDRAERAR